MDYNPRVTQAIKVDGRIKDQSWKFITDTGADTLIISQPLAEALRIKANKKSAINIVGIDGENKRVLKAIGNAPLAIQDVFVLINLQIVPSKSKILLLGID